MLVVASVDNRPRALREVGDGWSERGLAGARFFQLFEPLPLRLGLRSFTEALVKPS